jgi:Sugar (and other) transporter
VAHDRSSEARYVLWRLQNNAHAISQDHVVINAEMHEIEHALEEERAAAGGTTFLAIFKSGPQRFRRRTLLGIGGQFMQQLSGINLITYVSYFLTNMINLRSLINFLHSTPL